MFVHFYEFEAHNDQLNPNFSKAKREKTTSISVLSDLSDSPLVTSIDERCFQNLTGLQRM